LARKHLLNTKQVLFQGQDRQKYRAIPPNLLCEVLTLDEIAKLALVGTVIVVVVVFLVVGVVVVVVVVVIVVVVGIMMDVDRQLSSSELSGQSTSSSHRHKIEIQSGLD
jgi:hypothetical protein